MLASLLPGAVFAAEQLSLAEISAYLNGMTTVRSEFRQMNDDGSVSTGTLYIDRPGRMRFEYDPPQQAVVLASAQAVYIIDGKSNQPPETYPLSRTPLSLILGRNIDLGRANMVREARFDGTATIVTAEDPDNREGGMIELAFTDGPVALREWVIHDATGGRTRVILETLETGMSLPASLFDPDLERRGRDR
jgi:outer membrane lipoprotein-sorting protein